MSGRKQLVTAIGLGMLVGALLIFVTFFSGEKKPSFQTLIKVAFETDEGRLILRFPYQDRRLLFAYLPLEITIDHNGCHPRSKQL